LHSARGLFKTHGSLKDGALSAVLDTISDKITKAFKLKVFCCLRFGKTWFEPRLDQTVGILIDK
jgi:hypothetical protein